MGWTHELMNSYELMRCFQKTFFKLDLAKEQWKNLHELVFPSKAFSWRILRCFVIQ